MTVYMCIAGLGYSNRTDKHDKLCTQHRGSYSDKKTSDRTRGQRRSDPPSRNEKYTYFWKVRYDHFHRSFM